MKVDKRQFTKTEPRVHAVDMRGPLFIAGFSENYSPPYLSVRTKQFFCGNLRNLRINDKQVDWLTPRSSGLASATPEFHRFSSAASKTTNNFQDVPRGTTTSTTTSFFEKTRPFRPSSNSTGFP